MISTKCNYASIDEDRKELEMLSTTLECVEGFRKVEAEKVKQLDLKLSNEVEEKKNLKKQLELLSKVIDHLIDNYHNDSCNY